MNQVVVKLCLREKEVLFVDLRRKGDPYEKKFVQLSPDTIKETAELYHRWQLQGALMTEFDKPEYCHPATFAEIVDNDYSLVPSKYIKFDNSVTHEDYADKMSTIKSQLADVLKEEDKSRKDLMALFDDLGFSIEL